MVKDKSLKVVWTTIIASFFALGGWAIFKGFVNIFGLENIGPIWSIILGVGIIWITSYLGLKKLAK